MKRTQKIDLSALRKAPRSFAFKPIAVAVAAGTLAGCSDDSSDARIYVNVEDCISTHPEQREACEVGYQQALQEAIKSGPKYRSMADCAADFGDDNCQELFVNDNQSIFMPLMAGYILGEIVDEAFDRRRSAPLYTSYSRRSPAYRQWTSTSGVLYGSRSSKGTVKVTKDAFKPKPAVKRTISRGGFGSTIAAKSNFGGSSKSKRSSWGG
ncbi:MAG: DUF1190 domain-containing protein [Pseudomonadales bacterium]